MDRELAISLGKAARKARKALALTQEKVAEQLDVSVEFYARIERGVARPSVKTFACMVSVLGVSADALLGLESERKGAAKKHAALQGPVDPPELRSLAESLRQARPATLRLVRLLLKVLDELDAAGEQGDANGGKRPRKRGSAGKKQPRKAPPACSDEI